MHMRLIAFCCFLLLFQTATAGPVSTLNSRTHQGTHSSQASAFAAIVDKARRSGTESTLSFRISQAFNLIPDTETTPVAARILPPSVDERAGVGRGFYVSLQHDDVVVLMFRTYDEVLTFLTDSSAAFKGAAKWTRSTNAIEIIEARDVFEAEKQFWIAREGAQAQAPVFKHQHPGTNP